MKFSQRTTETGSGLIIAAGAIALLSLMVGSYFLTLIPKYRSVHQSTSWREAQHAAQGGVNYALQTLNQFAASGADPDSYSWSSDWSGNSWSFTTAEGDHILNNTALPVFGGRDNSGVSDLRVDVYTREPGTNRPWFRIRSSGRADVPGKLVSADRRDADLRRMALGASTSH